MQLKKLAANMGICIGLYLTQPIPVHGQGTPVQDTLKLGIKDAEQIFLNNNLSLLAQQYHIAADKALIEQAKLWANPVINTDQNVYANNKWFEHTANTDGTYNGQVFIQVQQLIKTAGKRGKLINLAKTNTEISEWEFKDLMCRLKYELRKDFYMLIQLTQTRDLYKTELAQLDKLAAGMNAELKLGNIAQKDILRIQALRITTQQDVYELDKSLSDVEAELKTMLQIKGSVFILPVKDEAYAAPADITFDELLNQAKQNNTTYKLQQLQLKYQQQNLSYQQSLSIPDVTLAPSYDHNSNYTPNYVGLGISFPLPLIDRNQGNIKSAKWLVREQEANVALGDLQLQNNLESAYKKWKAVMQMNNKETDDFKSDYGRLYGNIVESYRQRQISLLEFIDYFEVYKDTKEKEMLLDLNTALAKEELNYQTGTDILP